MEFWKKTLKMKRYQKIALISFGCIFILLMGIQLFLDINPYKDKIESYVQEKSGYVLLCQGPMKLKIFPLAIQLQEVVVKKHLKNPHNLVQIDKIHLSPNLLPLIFGQKSLNIELWEVKFNKYHLAKFKTKIKHKGSVIEFLKTALHFAHDKEDRKLNIDYIQCDLSDKTPEYKLQHKSNDFSLAFLGAFTNKAKVTGDTRLHLDLTAKGQTVLDIKKSLSGHFEFEILNGKLHGMDLLDSLREAKSIFETLTHKLSHTLTETFDALVHRKHFVPKATTSFDHLKITGKIHQGLIETEESNIQHDHFHIKGHGNINIAKNMLEYKVIAYYKEKGVIVSPKSLNRLAPLVINFGGSLDKVSIKPELNSYINYIQDDSNPSVIKEAPKKVLKSVKKLIRSFPK